MRSTPLLELKQEANGRDSNAERIHREVVRATQSLEDTNLHRHQLLELR